MLLPSFYTLINGTRYDLEASLPDRALEEASRLWCEFRDQSGEGVSRIGNGCRVYRQGVEDDPGSYVGAVSYNGRTWTPEQHEEWPL